MNRLFLMFLSLCLAFLVNAQTTQYNWAQQGGAPDMGDSQSDIATAADGTLVAAGEFIDNAQFGDHELSAVGGTDIYLTRFSAEGNVLWAIAEGANNNEYIREIAIAANGNILISGLFYNQTVIGGVTLNSLGGQDCFVASYSADGNFQWIKQIGSAKTDYLTALAVGPDGSLLVGGYFYDDLQLEEVSLQSSGAADVFLAKYTQDGDLCWAQSQGGSAGDLLESLSVDVDGNIFYTGTFYSSTQIGNSQLNTGFPNGYYVARFTPDGSFDWVRMIDESFSSQSIYCHAGRDNSLFVAGNFSDTLVINNQQFVAGGGNQDVFVTRIDVDGNFLWTMNGTSSANNDLKDLSVDAANNIILTGHYMADIRFGKHLLSYTLCCGSTEIFLVKFNAQGASVWASQVTGERSEVFALDAFGVNRFYFAGAFTTELVFDEIELSSSEYRNFYACLATDEQVGLAAQTDEIEIQIHPNPAVDYLHYSVPEAGKYQSIELISYTGQCVRREQLNNSGQLAIHGLPKGYYVVRLVGDAAAYTKAVLIQK